MKRVLVPGLLVLLAACGTPQEQCISGVTRDLRVVDGLIAETEGNLSRGYAFEQVTTFTTAIVDCTPRPTENDPEPDFRQCVEQMPQSSSKPVAIDLNAEAAKLASLRTKRGQLSQAASSAIAQCKAIHPE